MVYSFKQLFYKNNKVTFIPVKCREKVIQFCRIYTVEIFFVYSTFLSDQQKLICQCLYLIVVVAMQILCRFSEFSKVFHAEAGKTSFV